MKRLFILIVLVVNCGFSGDKDIEIAERSECYKVVETCDDGKQDVSEELRDALTEVELELGIKVDYDVVFTDIKDGSVLGQCWETYEGKTLMILIDKPYWDKADSDGKRQLILHEIGHCSLGLGHTSDSTAVMYYTMAITGLKGRYKQAQQEFIELYNNYNNK